MTSRVEQLYKRYWKSPEIVERERVEQACKNNQVQCEKFMDEAYACLAGAFSRGQLEGNVYLGEHHSPDAFACAAAKLKEEGISAHRECEYGHCWMYVKYSKE
jgi:hypothetical protein